MGEGAGRARRGRWARKGWRAGGPARTAARVALLLAVHAISTGASAALLPAAAMVPTLMALVHETLLIALAILLVIGIDDLLVDGLWLAGIARRPRPAPCGTLAGPIAILVPLWDEAEVAGAMLRHNARALADADCVLVVGCYPNDPATRAAVAAAAVEADRHGWASIRLVLNPCAGPTTKGDNLNAMVAALAGLEATAGRAFVGLTLHDAEDVIDPAEPELMRRWWTIADFVQLPVVPLVGAGTQWVAGHNADEFADLHRRLLPLRCAMGAGVPGAGVGGGWRRAALDRLTAAGGGRPFAADSLTEDYESGLLSARLGLGCRFVTERDENGRLIATRACFPSTLRQAVRQKGRWIAGIAFAGWDRLGWRGPAGRRAAVGGWGAAWMLWRDRRAPVAALGLSAAWTALALTGFGWLLDPAAARAAMGGHACIDTALAAGLPLLAWRVGWRMRATHALYGWGQALRAPLRMVVGNAVLVLATIRAVAVDARARARGRPVWDKTPHAFPDLAA